MLLDPLANALSKIYNCEKAGKKEVVVYPTSRLIERVLEVFKEEGYIEDFVREGNTLRVKLRGRINRCGAIKPRHSVKKGEYEKWEKRFLPASGLGTIVITSSQGVISLSQAKERGVGGKLLAYVY
ncbi:MAG: 30S ribosomal protein S8 [Hadesarchaea archaeon]|nr:MAG: 30S ribosomal protein S8 [Hadesarchaea archaeon]